MKKVIVVSAINLREGGTLTILNQCLNSLSETSLKEKYRIIALVHKKTHLNYSGIEFIEFPKSIKSYLYRLFYEYYYFKKLSERLKPYLWLSLHDMTPNVKAEKRAVYMHNSTPFFKIKLSDFKFDKTYIFFALFYKYLYKINIQKNNWCIVQQKWLKTNLSQMLNFPLDKFIVARPEYETKKITKSDGLSLKEGMINKSCFNLFYPSLPRPFKNFEVVCEAAKIIEKIYPDIIFYLTINGKENSYSKSVFKKYKNLKNIRFIGLIPRDEMDSWYNSMDALIFPSRLESWGLPISEFKIYNKPMILADLAYAKETAEGASCVAYFDPKNPEQLAELILELYNNNMSKFSDQPINNNNHDIILHDFKDLFYFLLDEKL